MPNKVFSIEKGSLITLTNWLSRQAIPGLRSRERTRFLNAIKPELLAIEDFRLSLVHEYAETDEKGEYIMVEDERGRLNYDLSDDNRKLIEEKFAQKLEEIYTLEVPADLEKSYHFVKGYVMNTAAEFVGKEAEEYDKWCVAFEADKDAQEEAEA